MLEIGKCKICGDTRQVYAPHKNNPGSWITGVCQSCRTTARKRRMRLLYGVRKLGVDDLTRVFKCHRCSLEKFPEEFSVGDVVSAEMGFAPTCRICRNAKAREYRAKLKKVSDLSDLI